MNQLALPLCSTDARRKPASGNERVLRALMEHQGEWVPLSYARLGCIVHSRVADLRADGWLIDCQRNGALYEYRLTGRAH